ncbi:conserved Plasmodium protein, unknown function [Plasmodium ovale wallikeri]|uniref:Plasmodium RESA N-terminal domain-containing protein n=1 Tax=Plasmodium ovale wallikeri TaxID=864142 RepID=A0A1A9ANR3_PLAOA|nr:conserved Plasmodium protein, unknown function [Plasmodium ovale wallikeri]
MTCDNSDVKSGSRSRIGKAKMFLTSFLPSEILKSKGKSAKINMGTLLNVILVSLLIWNCHYSYDMNSFCKRNMSQGLFGQRYERVIAELEEHPYKRDFVVGVKTKKNKSAYCNQSNEETTGQSEELKELYSKVSNEWKEFVSDMEQEYNSKTDQIEDIWRDGIWNNKWSPYLEHVHSTINNKLHDTTNSPHITENEIGIILSYVYDVFQHFVDLVNEDSSRLQKI